MLYESTLGQELYTVPIGAAIKGDVEVELGGIDTDCGARDRDALRIAGELELGSRRPQVLEGQVAVAQDVDLTVLDPTVHPAGHLEDLVRAEVCAGQYVLAALHHIRVARIIDHDGVEPADVERGLPSGRHGEQERPFDQTVKKRSNDSNRLTAVIKGSRQVGPTVAELLGDLLDLGAGWHEDGDTAALAHDPFYEAIVQELERLLRQDIDLCGLGGIKRPSLEHLGGTQILRVEARIHGRGQPDKAAPGALPERETQLHFRRGLVNLVHDERVPHGDEAILEPAARDSGRDDDDVPGRRFGRRFPLAIDDSDLQWCLQNGLRHAADRECLAGARPGHDPEPLARAGKPANVLAVLALEQRLQV